MREQIILRAVRNTPSCSRNSERACHTNTSKPLHIRTGPEHMEHDDIEEMVLAVNSGPAEFGNQP